MPYKFNFDLSKVPRFFFREIARVANEKKMHKRIGRKTRELLERFKVHEITGLNVSEAIVLLEDFIDIQVRNLTDREGFSKAKRRALLLPHCSRKYMDSRCKAVFDPAIPSYRCQHCSQDCLIHQATLLGEKREYDVYVLPGGSCIARILAANSYEAVVGVACGEEAKLGMKLLDEFGMPGQAVPLIKNGCANTCFDIKMLNEIL